MDARSPVNVHRIDPTAHVSTLENGGYSHIVFLTTTGPVGMVAMDGAVFGAILHVVPSYSFNSLDFDPFTPFRSFMKSERCPDNRYEGELGQTPFPALARKAEKTPSAL